MAEPMSDDRLNTLDGRVNAAYYAQQGPSSTWAGHYHVDVGELLAEVARLRKQNAALQNTNAWEIMGTYLAERGAHMGNVTPYGVEPGSDAEPIVDLSTLPGWVELRKTHYREALEKVADAMPIDLWVTYGRTPRIAAEGIQKWLREQANKL